MPIQFAANDAACARRMIATTARSVVRVAHARAGRWRLASRTSTRSQSRLPDSRDPSAKMAITLVTAPLESRSKRYVVPAIEKKTSLPSE